MYLQLERFLDDLQNPNLVSNFSHLRGHFYHFWVQKIRFLDFLKVICELFRSSLWIIFSLLRPTFGCMLSSKVRYMAPKIKMYGQSLVLWDCHFDDFHGQKASFLEFSRVILQLINSDVLGIFYELILLALNRLYSLRFRGSPIKTETWLHPRPFFPIYKVLLIYRRL